LHRVTQARLAAARAEWAPVFAHLPRPLVAVSIGGTNGRFTLDAKAAGGLAADLAAMMDRDRVGLMLTPSRRTDPRAIEALRAALEPRGAYIWDGSGENPYFGMLALADLIIVTIDSVSMVSEAAATTAPVLVAALPGRSRRIGLFNEGLVAAGRIRPFEGRFTEGLTAAGRIRPFEGRFAQWPVTPLDDTAEAAQEMRRRLGF
jgi:mitochondrial fission protein ELM1